MATARTPRCDLCGHALSVHNELGYCWVSSRTKGQCPCDMTTSCIPRLPERKVGRR